MGALLYDYQLDAIKRMHNGCILVGDVGSGKSRTSLAYYFKEQGGSIDPFKPIKKIKEPLYIITTAQKRDLQDWKKEAVPFLFPEDPKVDSWNNIKKYTDISGAFFILDEQHICGSGAWVKSFYQIAKKNRWILLSATPADTWSDLIPTFVANGFYKNKTDFCRQHIIYDRWAKYPKVDRYVNTGKLIKYRRYILIDMEYSTKTIKHHEYISTNYDKELYKYINMERKDPYNECIPIMNAAGLCYLLRKVVNSDPSRLYATKDILDLKKKVILFYNFDYELDLLRTFDWGDDVTIAEWNGHIHQDVPKTDKWLYLVNYAAGAEGWNCITTDTTIFFSQNYSYRTMIQASGRINRVNTPFKDLYYYHFKSNSQIDRAIYSALSKKKNFNEKNFIRDF